MEIQRYTDISCILGEGPLWDPRDQLFYWVDIMGMKIWRADVDGHDATSWSVPEHIGTMALREKGGAVVALRTGYQSFDFASGECTAIIDPEAELERTRFNDGKVDRKGRFVAGTMDYQVAEPLCGFYSLAADMRCTRIGGGVTIFNAPCWSPDNTVFYHADTPAGLLFASDYDLDSGTISNTRVLVGAGDAPGLPDGATVDAEGYIWSARWGAGRIIRFTPDGRVDRTVEIPASRTTSCAFGGPNLDRLYVTSMIDVDHPDNPDDPQAGQLFVVDGLGIKGLPEPRFAG